VISLPESSKNKGSEKSESSEPMEENFPGQPFDKSSIPSEPPSPEEPPQKERRQRGPKGSLIFQPFEPLQSFPQLLESLSKELARHHAELSEISANLDSLSRAWASSRAVDRSSLSPQLNQHLRPPLEQ